MARPQTSDAVLLFDGRCPFCTWAARWIRERADPPLRTLPWQAADLESLCLREDEARRTVWWVEPGRERAIGHANGSAAIARALLRMRGPWPLAGRAMLLPGVRRLAAIGYEVVARHRHRLPGIRPACDHGGAR